MVDLFCQGCWLWSIRLLFEAVGEACGRGLLVRFVDCGRWVSCWLAELEGAICSFPWLRLVVQGFGSGFCLGMVCEAVGHRYWTRVLLKVVE